MKCYEKMEQPSTSTGLAVCFDPLKVHKKPITNYLRLVTPLFGLSQDLAGKWLCKNCIKALKPSDDATAAPKVCFAPYGHRRRTIQFVVCIGPSDNIPDHVNKWVCTNCLKRLKKDAADATKSDQTLEVGETQIVSPSASHGQSEEGTANPDNQSLELEERLINEAQQSSDEQHQAKQEAVENVSVSCIFSEKDGTPQCSSEKFGDFCSLPESTIKALLFLCESKREDKPKDSFICVSHYNFYFGSLEKAEDSEFDVCCDPCKIHFKYIVRDCCYTSLYTVVYAQSKGVALKLNAPLCRNCRKFISDMPTTTEPSSTQTSTLSSDNGEIQLSGTASHVMELSPVVVMEELNCQLNSMGLSPANVKGLTKSEKADYARHKLQDVTDSMTKTLSRALELQESTILTPKLVEEQMASEHKNLMLKIKEKLMEADRKTSQQLLTLCPESWTPNYAAKFFGVSRHLVVKARELRNKLGILSTPSYASKSAITDELKKIVENFYCDDMYTRIMPGKKDCVSLGHGKHMQKRLILCNLVELYSEFKKKNPEIAKTIGKSTFILLRPKWCVIAGSAGTHNVCVCETHQNAKLLLRALGLSPSIREIIPQAVCGETRECMLSVCPNCPSEEKISENIQCLLRATRQTQEEEEEEEEEDDDDSYFQQLLNEEIEYKQWQSTDRDKLSSKVASIGEVIEILAASLKNLVCHDFIAYQQALFIKELKENLAVTKAIILMDFSMNYTCVVQDAIQKYHWSKKGITLHPVVIYYKDSDDITKNFNLCFISDDIKHDVTQVRLFQEQTIRYIQQHIPKVTEVLYVTDGCASQYKCCTSFFNLCQHEQNLGLKAEWCFFATSHGKSPCDGIGGLVKREAYKESLKRPYSDQILNANQFYDFCKNSSLSENINFIMIGQATVAYERQKEASIQAIPIPGTRSFHHFKPISGTTIECKRISFDAENALVHNLTEIADSIETEAGSYVAVLVETKIYIGLVSDVNEDDGECEMSLLHPSLPATVYSWAENLLSCIVPLNHIICSVNLTERVDLKYELPQAVVKGIREMGSRRRKQLLKTV